MCLGAEMTIPRQIAKKTLLKFISGPERNYSTARAMDSVQRKTASARYLNRTVRRPTPHAHGTQSTRTHPDKNGISKNPHLSSE